MLDFLTNKKNELFGEQVSTAELRSAIAHEVWRNSAVLRSAKFSGKGVMIAMGEKLVVPSNPGANVAVYTDFTPNYRSLVQHPMSNERWDTKKFKPGEIGYVAADRCYRQICFTPTNPQHVLLASLGLIFRSPEALVSWAKSWGFKSNLFFSVRDVPETPRDFIPKAEKYAENAEQSNKSVV